MLFLHLCSVPQSGPTPLSPVTLLHELLLFWFSSIPLLIEPVGLQACVSAVPRADSCKGDGVLERKRI